MHDVKQLNLFKHAHSNHVARRVQGCALHRFLRFLLCCLVNDRKIYRNFAHIIRIVENFDRLVFLRAGHYDWALQAKAQTRDRFGVETIGKHLVFQINLELGVTCFIICLDAVVLIAVDAAEHLLTYVRDEHILIP
jgi:hypothetical protein